MCGSDIFPDFSGGDFSTVLTSKIRIWKARHWACWAMVHHRWEMYIVWGSSHCVFVCCEYKWSFLWDTAPPSSCCWQKHAQVYPATLKRIMMSTWTMSLSARRPREDTLTSSPSSSSIAKGIGIRQRQCDSKLEPQRENIDKVQDVPLYFCIFIM